LSRFGNRFVLGSFFVLGRLLLLGFWPRNLLRGGFFLSQIGSRPRARRLGWLFPLGRFFVLGGILLRRRRGARLGRRCLLLRLFCYRWWISLRFRSRRERRSWLLSWRPGRHRPLVVRLYPIHWASCRARTSRLVRPPVHQRLFRPRFRCRFSRFGFGGRIWSRPRCRSASPRRDPFFGSSCCRLYPAFQGSVSSLRLRSLNPENEHTERHGEDANESKHRQRGRCGTAMTIA
jgi:hypothetical protein